MPKKDEPKWDWQSPGAGRDWSVSVDHEIVDFLGIKDEQERQKAIDRINRALAQLLPPPEGAPTPKEIKAALDCLVESAGSLARNLPRIDERTITAIRLAGLDGLKKRTKYTGQHREIIDTAIKANQELLRLLKSAREFAPPPSLKPGPESNKQEQLVFNSLIDFWCEKKKDAPDRSDWFPSNRQYTGDCHAFLTNIFYERIDYSPSQIADRIKNYLDARGG